MASVKEGERERERDEVERGREVKRRRRRRRRRRERSDWATTIVASVKYCFPCQARRVCTNNDTSINVRIANRTAVY